MLLLLACEREAQVELPASAPRIALGAFLTPSQEVELRVFETTHLYAAEDVPVERALVNLYEDDRFLARLEHDSAGVYRSSSLPKEGSVYRVEVTVEGLGTAVAQTSVPRAASLDSVNMTRFTGTSPRGGPLSRLELHFSDTDTPPEVLRVLQFLLL